MKKLIIAAFMAVLFVGPAIANDASKINVRIKTNFTTEFSKATKVQWTLRDAFAKATFMNNGEKMEAFYDLSGEMIGTSRHVSLGNLPATARKMVAKKYPGYTITEAILFNNKIEDAYFISAENDKYKIIFKVKETSTFSVFEKTKK